MYTKTQWVDNTTPIDKDNLNKIEQGIYDNSLVVDAVTNTLNPTDTETYKTAELTEGQITDVIGVNDIVIKGQTEQDGTPTPSAPVDVNVVSGDNVIEIKSKNLININTLSNGYILGTGDISTQSTNEEMYSEFIKVKPNTAYTFKIFETTWSGFNSSNWIGIGEYRSIQNPIRNGFIQRGVMGIGTQNYYTITTTANTNYIIVSARGLVSATKIQLEQNSTATSYTNYHSGKEFSLDLGSIELCKIGNYQDYFYKSGSKWYLHKETVKDVVDENNTIAIVNTGTSNWYYKITPKKIVPTASQTNQICNYYPNREIFNGNTNQGILKISNGEEIRIRYGTEDTVANFKTWLASNNIILYSLLATATDTEITDTTLKSQLEAIYNAPLYEQTNITQTNNDLPMVLDITACKDNINGIKAFIRK